MSKKLFIIVIVSDVFAMIEKSIVRQNGRIDEKKLFEIIGNGAGKPRTSSSPIPLAHTNQLCELDKQVDALYRTARLALDNLLKQSLPLAAILELQLLYGLRISEVLSIKSTDIMASGHIRIGGLKNSSSRIIIPVETRDWFLKQRGLNIPVFQDYDRFYIYRLYKKMGLHAVFNGRNKKSVTHLFRHLLIKSFKHNKIKTDESKEFIGHKAKKSTEVYER